MVVQNYQPAKHLHLSGTKRAAALAGKRGFALLELIAAFGIIAILAAIAGPTYSDYAQKVRVARCMAEIHSIEVAISVYLVDHSTLPVTLSQAGCGNLCDPWGHPYQYLDIADSSKKGKADFRKDRFLNPLNSDYDLYSMGQDGLSKPPLNAAQSRDDVIRANNGGFVGSASDF